MDEEQIEKFIELIQCRPPLYDKRLKAYTDRNITKILWKEVCEAMIDSWSVMTPEEKVLKVKEIQQRWQNLRTCFKREIKKSKSNELCKKRRKYIYYNQLLFLLPTIEDTSLEPTAQAQAQTIQPKVIENKRKHDNQVSSNLQVHLNQTHKEKIKPRPASSSYERTVFNVKKDTKDDIDEDKCFLISLVPSFRRMTDDQKIEAKIEFLSIIRQINQSKTSTDRNFKQDFPQSSSPYFTQTSQRIVPSTPAYSDSSQSSFMSSNNPISSDFIEISDFKIE